MSERMILAVCAIIASLNLLFFFAYRFGYQFAVANFAFAPIVPIRFALAISAGILLSLLRLPAPLAFYVIFAVKSPVRDDLSLLNAALKTGNYGEFKASLPVHVRRLLEAADNHIAFADKLRCLRPLLLKAPITALVCSMLSHSPSRSNFEIALSIVNLATEISSVLRQATITTMSAMLVLPALFSIALGGAMWLIKTGSHWLWTICGMILLLICLMNYFVFQALGMEE